MGIGKKNGHRVTIQDVAAMAQVAASTVSHVLNGTAPITEETKKRVMNAVEVLGYLPNASARSLRRQKTGLIGVAVQDIASEFYARCASILLAEARKDNTCVLLCDAYFDNETLKQGVMTLIERQVDGLIFIGGGNDDDIIEEAVRAHVPVLFGDRRYKDFPSVEFDNRGVVRRLVRILYDSGYRRFHYVGEPVELQQNLSERYRGFQEELQELNIPEEDIVTVFREDFRQEKTEKSYEYFIRYFEDYHPAGGKEVIVTSNDLIAYGIIAAAGKRNISIPEDIAIVGFDNILMSAYFSPALTTVQQDENLLGKKCYELFRKMTETEGLQEHLILQPEIILRNTTIVPEEAR